MYLLPQVDIKDIAFLAEGVGFEPTFAFAKAVFKTAAIVHSATPPGVCFTWKVKFSQPCPEGRLNSIGNIVT